MITICGVAARSGGHILPCLTLMQTELSKHKDAKALFFTSHTELDSVISKQYPWITNRITLTLENIPYKKPWRLPLFVTHFAMSFFKSLYYLAKHRPQKIISTGGYLSIPVCLAGRLLRIPIELFELNAIPGKAARFLAPLSSTLLTCFKTTQKHFKKPCKVTNYPLRYTQAMLNNNAKEQTYKKLGFTTERKTLFILGGSQGSAFLNVQICNLLSIAGKETYQVIHQAGHAHINGLRSFYKQLNIPAHVFDYEQELAPYYQSADTVICRAGAGALFEVAFFKKRCITIPLEIASTTHQIDNALAIQEHYPDLFTVIKQSDCVKDSTLLFNELLSS